MAHDVLENKKPYVHHSATGISNIKMGIWLMIATECMTFGSAIATYILFLDRNNGGPTVKEIFDIPFTSASTFILLMSSLSMVLALDALESKNLRNFRVWLFSTAALGGVFLAGQIYEFTSFVNEGFKWWTSPVSGAFFTLTTFHGVHVAFGVIALILMGIMSFSDRFNINNPEPVEVLGLFWHFVDIVWIVIFTVIYLIPVG